MGLYDKEENLDFCLLRESYIKGVLTRKKSEFLSTFKNIIQESNYKEKGEKMQEKIKKDNIIYFTLLYYTIYTI